MCGRLPSFGRAIECRDENRERIADSDALVSQQFLEQTFGASSGIAGLTGSLTTKASSLFQDRLIRPSWVVKRENHVDAG
ncbi:hypothetical protein GGQ85_003532 [Nitrobacter vulgaris]|uniref:hypothetical protein n=1 Tax=Nitrobacter vulgaris TaxID=29421 RepID=UPI002866A429|nr:hypothetical protein [Nitrobacter vulgaris]MDR6305807.1 hypothetical protein [Nitrobacter vulgaris]